MHIDFVRELAGDIYFGKHRRAKPDPSGERATDEAVYTTGEIERVAKYAFARAEARTGRLASVDKANVLSTSQLWRRTVTRMAADHPNVKLEHLYVDNAAMQLVLAPAQFDVILTSNMFGDILTDLGAALVGSIGLIPSMSSGPGPSLYEPIHGSAPTLAGKDVANPVGMILSAAMMLRESFGLNARSRMDRIRRGPPVSRTASALRTPSSPARPKSAASNLANGVRNGRCSRPRSSNAAAPRDVFQIPSRRQIPIHRAPNTKRARERSRIESAPGKPIVRWGKRLF